MKEHEVLVCVNGAALALKDPIVPRITFMNTSIAAAKGAGLETYRSLGRLKTDHLIIIEGSPDLSERWISILERASYNSFDFYSLDMRMEFMKKLLGPLKGVQGDHVPSTGVFAILALLAQGAKSIRLNGFSLVDGHSYLNRSFRRHHIEMDRHVFELVQRKGLPVSGTIEIESGEISL